MPKKSYLTIRIASADKSKIEVIARRVDWTVSKTAHYLLQIGLKRTRVVEQKA